MLATRARMMPVKVMIRTIEVDVDRRSYKMAMARKRPKARRRNAAERTLQEIKGLHAKR